MSRPIPEFHHLAHGRGDAAGIDMAAVAFGVFGTLAVPRIVLVPEGLAERAYYDAGLATVVEAAVLGHRVPFSHDVGRGAEVVVAYVLDFLAERVQGKGKAFRNVLRVVLARGGVS